MTARTTALGLLAALAIGVTSPALASTTTVHVGSFFFEDSPSGDGQVVVTQGDRITFTFEGNTQHTATVDGMFDSGVRNPGQTYTTGTLMRPGTFTLYCTVHGAARHSTTLVIRASSNPSPSPTTAKPSPTPTKARPAPSPTRSSPTPSPSPRPSRSASPTPSASPTRSASASPSASPSPTPSVAAVSPTSAPTPSSSPSPTPVAVNAPDVIPATSIDDSAPSWLLPGALVALILLLGAGAIVAGRRRQV